MVTQSDGVIDMLRPRHENKLDITNKYRQYYVPKTKSQ